MQNTAKKAEASACGSSACGSSACGSSACRSSARGSSACGCTHVLHSNNIPHLAISVSALTPGPEAGGAGRSLPEQALCQLFRLPGAGHPRGLSVLATLPQAQRRAVNSRHRAESFLAGRKSPACLPSKASHRREAAAAWAPVSGQLQHSSFRGGSGLPKDACYDRFFLIFLPRLQK